MRIPTEHILTLELIRLYKLKLGTFNDFRTKFVFHEHHDSLMEFLNQFSNTNGCSFFGANCEAKLKKLRDLFEEVAHDIACLPFDKVIEKYDWYTVGNWLKEKLPEFSTIERLHYIVITSLGSSLHENLINLLYSDILHYEKV